MELWFVASVDEGTSHLPSLPDHSEEGSVRPRVTYPRTGMLATCWNSCSFGNKCCVITSQTFYMIVCCFDSDLYACCASANFLQTIGDTTCDPPLLSHHATNAASFIAMSV